jgi:hypothetical protein
MTTPRTNTPSPPLAGEREGARRAAMGRVRWSSGQASHYSIHPPHPTLSPLKGGEGYLGLMGRRR